VWQLVCNFEVGQMFHAKCIGLKIIDGMIKSSVIGRKLFFALDNQIKSFFANHNRGLEYLTTPQNHLWLGQNYFSLWTTNTIIFAQSHARTYVEFELILLTILNDLFSGWSRLLHRNVSQCSFLWNILNVPFPVG
jgi:hypothetical protein